jgi:hypothetical protein
MDDKDPTLIGVVTELDVFGWGKNSAQLQFKIAPPNGPEQTFVMESDTEPQLFAGAATILMNAYQTRMHVMVTFASGTSKAKGVKVPAFTYR